jgi:hypothetical protein
MAFFKIINLRFPTTLALMAAPSSCGGVSHKRYSGKKEVATYDYFGNALYPILYSVKA